MGHFLDVAQQILEDSKAPLSAKEIVNLAKVRGILHTTGKAPEEIMKSKLSTNILNKKESSIFVRTEKGRFTLRVWKDTYGEYIADRYKKALLDEDIVVFPAKSLRKYITGTGIRTTPLENRRELISELFSEQRRVAEKEFSIIQLVSAFIIKYQNKYLTYKRTARLPEERLHGVYSIPFGGHLNPDDILPLFDIFDPKIATVVLTRELREEIILEKNRMPNIEYVGLLYDDSRDISRQHLGIVYHVYFDSPEFKIGERGFLMDAKFETLDEIQARRADFENWSWKIIDFERSINNYPNF